MAVLIRNSSRRREGLVERNKPCRAETSDIGRKVPRISEEISNIKGRQQAGDTGTSVLFINRCSLLVDYWPGNPCCSKEPMPFRFRFVYPVVASSFAPMQKRAML